MKEYNNGMRNMLTILDVFSKFAFAKPLINKQGPTVLNALYDISEVTETQQRYNRTLAQNSPTKVLNLPYSNKELHITKPQ